LTSKADTPQSASPETQKLIDGCLALAEGNSDGHQELLSETETRMELMNQSMDGFFAEIDEQGPEFYQSFRHHFEGIEAAYQAYGQALEQILESGQNEETDFHQIACNLAIASEGLRVGMSMYEEDYLSRGPSQFPIVNLLHNVARALREGTTTLDAWEQTCDRYIGFYQGAIDEIDNSEHQDKPGVPERRESFRVITECLEQLRAFDHSSSPVSELEGILARLSAAHVDLEQAMDTYHHAEFSEGPSKGAKFNWIIKAAEGVLEGTYQPEVLGALAQDALDVTQQHLAEMKEVSRQKLDSVTLNEELARMIEAAEGVEDALSFLIDFSDDPEMPQDQVREAIDELIESGDLLVEATNLVTEYGKTAGKVTCVRCQTAQEPGNRVCASCGAQLPSLPGTGAYSPGNSSMQVREGKAEDVIDQEEVMTDVMKALFDACEEFMEGRKTFADLDSHLARSLSNVDHAERALSELEAPAVPEEATPEERELAQGFINMTEDALATLEQGVAECRVGLNQIGQGARSQEPEMVKEGMGIYYQGTQKLWQVKRLDHELTQYIEADDKTPDQINHSEESVQLSRD
jgi:hypothetical protein